MRFEEHGPGEAGKRGGDGGIEAFEVTGGEDAAEAGSEGDQGIGLGEGRGDGFLDEDVEVGLQKLTGDGGVRRGGDADRGGVEA